MVQEESLHIFPLGEVRATFFEIIFKDTAHLLIERQFTGLAILGHTEEHFILQVDIPHSEGDRFGDPHPSCV